jgi:hypothetical protein
MEQYQPDLEIKKAHDIRRIEGCPCGGVGMRDQMIKIGGKWWHGRCAIAHHGIDKIAAMPKDAYGGLRWSEIGTEAMKRLLGN